LLIAAGAGTGKTKTLAHRVAHLILNGGDPQRLLLLTFTLRAALENVSCDRQPSVAAPRRVGRARRNLYRS
jgi:UvrD/REP helicase N-terminal domain